MYGPSKNKLQQITNPSTSQYSHIKKKNRFSSKSLTLGVLNDIQFAGKSNPRIKK